MTEDEGSGGGSGASERVVDERARDGASRPLVERVGLAAIAGVLAAVFAFVAAAAFTSGELFLGVMAGIGALMTVWAAAATLRRG